MVRTSVGRGAIGVLILLSGVPRLCADGYSDALVIVEEMDRLSTASLEAAVNYQQQGRLLEAAGGCAKIAKQMKIQQDRVWQIYMQEGTMAVQSLYLASSEQTHFWLAEMNAFTMMARGMHDMAQLHLDQVKLCQKAFAASMHHASLCRELGL